MSIETVRSQVKSLAVNICQAALHSQFPNDFEYYALGLDLTDSENRIIETLVFPVMPENITEPRPSINSVNKTQAGVVSVYNNTFVPFEISIRGTFGRKLRILANNPAAAFSGIKGKVQGNDYDAPVFNSAVKTGYGTIKLLERLRDLSFSVDESGKPTRLFYYNLAFNSQYMVEFKQFTATQDRQNNMLWYYTAVFKAIAPAYLVRANNKTSIISLMASSVINKGLDSLTTEWRNNYNTRKAKKQDRSSLLKHR